jgi:hypothetical protein
MCTGIFGLGFGDADVLAEDEAAEDEDPDALELLLTVPDGVPEVLLLQEVRNSASAESAARTGADRRTEVRRSTPPRYGTLRAGKSAFQLTPCRATAG